MPQPLGDMALNAIDKMVSDYRSDDRNAFAEGVLSAVNASGPTSTSYAICALIAYISDMRTMFTDSATNEGVTE